MLSGLDILWTWPWRHLLTCVCVLVVFGGGTCFGQGVSTTSGVQCLTRLRAPDYPVHARLGRSLGTLKVTASLTANGELHAYRIDEPSDKAFALRFGEEIEKALKLSTFSAACAGEDISLVFTFGFETSERRAGVFFGPPNHIEVIVENPPLIGAARVARRPDPR